MFGEKRKFDAYFESNPDKFFSLSKRELKLACHPEHLNNWKFVNTKEVEYAGMSDQQFNSVREYFNVHSACTNRVEKPAYEVFTQKGKQGAS
jgi:hypothetical protein